MNPKSLFLADPPELSDEAASEMLDFLYNLITAFENHYANQLPRYHQDAETPQLNLFEDFDDNAPPF